MLKLNLAILLCLSTLFSTYVAAETGSNSSSSEDAFTENTALNNISQLTDKLDINSANADDIASMLKGVGVQKAKAIVEFRALHGKFMSIEELAEVKGIGVSTLEKNKSVILIQ